MHYGTLWEHSFYADAKTFHYRFIVDGGELNIAIIRVLSGK